MKLTYEGLKDRTVWAAAGIDLPDYDPAQLSAAASTVKAPMAAPALWA